MKNFFKKLSFVLAVAMVLTSITPATASAAAKNYIYKKGKDAAVESVSVWFGDEATDLNVKINGKKNVAGTWKTGNPKIATIDKETGVVTPVANGSTKVRFTAETGESVVVALEVGTRVKTVKPHLGDGVKVTELAMTVGEEKTVKLGLGVSAKAAAAGAKSTSMVTAADVDGTAVKVVKGEGERTYTIEAVEAGEATITIRAHKATSLAAGKAFRNAKITVTVADKLNATQASKNTIKVTGSDLSETVADYELKRGNIVVPVKSVVVEDGVAVLTSSASKLTSGDYTLTYKKNATVELTIEDVKVKSIVVLSTSAPLVKGSTTSAVASYKVYDQFDNDVTADTTINNVNNIKISGSNLDGNQDTTPYRKDGKLVFTNASGFTPNLSIVTVSLVCVTNAEAENAIATLTIAESAHVKNVEIVGVYKKNNDGSYTEAVPTEGDDAVAVANYYVALTGTDQYGNPLLDADGVFVSVAGCGITQGTVKVSKINDVDYMVAPLQLTGVASALKGSLVVTAYAKMAGNPVTETYTVSDRVKVDTIVVSAPNGIYAAWDNELEFEAYDTNGNKVTSYETLNGYFKDTQSMSLWGDMRFVRQTGGSAKLYYKPAATYNNITVNVPVVATFITETSKLSTVNLTVQPARKAQAIIGLDAGTPVGVLVGEQLTIKAENFIVQDQYGNIIADDDLNKVALFTIEYDKWDAGKAFPEPANNATGTAISAKTDIVFDSTAAADPASKGAVTVNFRIQGVEGFDYSVDVKSVELKDIDPTTFKIADMDWQKELAQSDDIVLTGTANGTVITVPSKDNYVNVVPKGNTVADGNKILVKAPAVDTKNDTVTENDVELKLVINNGLGTEVTKNFTVSNTESAPTTITTEGTEIEVELGERIAVLDHKKIVKVVDQYNDDITETALNNARIQIIGLPEGSVVEDNNTVGFEPTVNGEKGKNYPVTITYTFDNGKTYTTEVTVYIPTP